MLPGGSHLGGDNVLAFHSVEGGDGIPGFGIVEDEGNLLEHPRWVDKEVACLCVENKRAVITLKKNVNQTTCFGEIDKDWDHTAY